MSDLDTRLVALGVDTELYDIAGDYISKAIELMSRWTDQGSTCDKLDDDEDPHIAWISGMESQSVSLYTVRVGIHATLPEGEEVLHVQHLVKARNGTDMSAITAANLVTLGGTLATKWSAMLNSSTPSLDHAPLYYLGSEVTYDELRLSLIEYRTAPDKPIVHVPTVYVSAGTPNTGIATDTLPYSLSMVLTLLTNARGKSHRGRIYLPPFGINALAAGGKYNQAAATDWGKGFGNNWIHELNTTTDYDVVVLSSRAKEGAVSTGAPLAPSALGVGGVKVGIVPDSQRRRRKSLDEAYTTPWGTAP